MKILSIKPIAFAQDAFAQYDVAIPTEDSRTAFIEALKRGQYDNIDCINRHLHDPVIGPFDTEIINALPKNIKVIGNVGAGYDQIDVAACTARGISVTHTPDAVRDATAETAVFLILGCVRHFGAGSNKLTQGYWLDGLKPGRSLGALTVGILGMGSIGGAICQRLAPFNCNLQYHNRMQKDTPITYIKTMDELLSTSDIIVVAVPLNAETRHLLDAAALGKMKQGSWLINIARGAVVDEEALVSALESGHLAGAGLDVFEHEPKVHPKLLELAQKQGLDGGNHVVLLPHMGTYTTDASKLMEETSLKHMLSVLAGGRQGVVPEQRSM